MIFSYFERIRTCKFAINLLFLLIILSCSQTLAQQQDPMTLNGGSIMAMAGNNCIAVAVDKRFGSGPQMVNIHPRTVYVPNSKIVVAFSGLEGDIQSLSSEIGVQVSAKVSRNIGFGFLTNSSRKKISPQSLSQLISHLLYRRRQSPYFVEPIIAGIERIGGDDHNENQYNDDENHNQKPLKYKPFLCVQDCIGAQSRSQSFVCSGAASKSLYGTAEALWKPGLNSEELVQICGKAFLSALERDCLSGYGAVIYLIDGENGIEQIDLVSRND